MPVVKGGVWTNIEDEILKAAVSKYGLNQWARVSSLLARKTPKQCKARWTEWLDPSIRKIEWSKEEDEKLLHLAKLMPTQWRTIAPIVGRTATQCLERYQKLLDEAEARENDELGLGLEGPTGGETAAPSADDVRRLRPGELDPDPESKPARPDTIDLDEDEKEMLSEARARLANTQGKKAKRKARERQLEESRRLAVLQKRRELKNAGINIKVVTRKKGEMDYNADIPFEKAPASGFYDTTEELVRNERQREAFDPRKQQLAIKRKGDQNDENDDHKRRRNEKGSAVFSAAAKAGQMQKIREAEQSSKRRPLVLPAPQISEGEMEDIVKMGRAGELASRMAANGENETTRGLIGNYTMVGNTPIRTPRAPPEEDRIANEIHNIRVLTQTQSSLLGGENTPLREGKGTTGFESITPRKEVLSTPNPLATPFRNGFRPGATPLREGQMAPGATPMRTPRDNFMINKDDGTVGFVGATPRDVKLQERAIKNRLHHQLASLPKPQQTEWELEELPEEQNEEPASLEPSVEDAAEIEKRNKAIREAAALAELKRQTQVIQRNFPRPLVIDADALLKAASEISDPAERLIQEEAALLILNDAQKFPIDGMNLSGKMPKPLSPVSDSSLARARKELEDEIRSDSAADAAAKAAFERFWTQQHEHDEEDVSENVQKLSLTFDSLEESMLKSAESANKVEKKLALHLGGYQKRQKMLRTRIAETAKTLELESKELETYRILQASEDAGVPSRLEKLREEVRFVSQRERLAQETYKQSKDELDDLEVAR